MQTDEEVMIEAGAQALANDVWHPPQPLKHLSPSDVRNYKRQARLVLAAVGLVTNEKT
jgi:hypothetical protein